MPTESPRWLVPVLDFPNHDAVDLVVYAVNGNVVMMPPSADGAYILPPSSDGKLSEAIREARGFAERRQGRS